MEKLYSDKSKLTFTHTADSSFGYLQCAQCASCGTLLNFCVKLKIVFEYCHLIIALGFFGQYIGGKHWNVSTHGAKLYTCLPLNNIQTVKVYPKCFIFGKCGKPRIPMNEKHTHTDKHRKCLLNISYIQRVNVFWGYWSHLSNK